MQTAQKVITAYRHKRIIVCLLVALATLGATLAIRFISQRSVNEDYIRTAASQRVAALNDILRPLSAQRATLLPLVGKPCPDIHLTPFVPSPSSRQVSFTVPVFLARDRQTYIACSPRFLRPALCCSSRTTAPCSKARRY